MVSLYKLDLNIQQRYFVVELQNHTDVSDWLRLHGEREYIYEVWKKLSVHSRWCWKLKKEKWGKLATPKK